MIAVGKYNSLQIARETSVGLFLEDKTGEDVLLPNRFCPRDYEVGDTIEVFIYLDREGRKVATNRKPKITLGGFGYLRVESTTDRGAFVDWGMDKHLFVPTSHQPFPLTQGRFYFIHMLQDRDDDRLFGSAKVERFFERDEVTVEEGQEVNLIVYQDADFGYSVIINNTHKGMVYKSEIFRDLTIGEELKGWVKKIREDNKIDISLQPIGYRKAIDPQSTLILQKLEEAGGFLPINDKSAPEAIYDTFHMSKKAFKKAIGSLYKERVIKIEQDGIHKLTLP